MKATEGHQASTHSVYLADEVGKQAWLTRFDSIHFSNKFIELGILIFRVGHHLAHVHAFHPGRFRALFLVLVGRFSLSSIFGKNSD